MSLMRLSDISRRRFLTQSISATIVSGALPHNAWSVEEVEKSERHKELTGAIGMVSASAHAQTTGRAIGRNFTLLEMPKILSEELNLSILDLNTMSFPSFAKVSATYIDQLRSAAEKADCILTNLKLNQRGFDMNSTDDETRKRAISEYKRSIDIAADLGCRWVRPLPQKETPDQTIHVASYQELCDYGATRNVQVLVENFGWMQSDSNAVPTLITAIGRNVAACPDTGNWNSNKIRYAGLQKAFPFAVTCDFKAKKLGPNGEHPAYDMKRCFEIAWNAGFRGPWAIEHGNPDTKAFLTGVAQVRDMLKKWTAAKLESEHE